MKLIGSPKAKTTISRIFYYYLPINERIANKIIFDIKRYVQLLRKFLLIAPIEPVLEGLSIEYRSLSVRKTYKGDLYDKL